MKTTDSNERWIKKTCCYLSNLSNWVQRSVLFAEAITKLSSPNASFCFSSLIRRGFTKRNPYYVTGTQAALYSILTGSWNLEHRTLTREAAAAFDETLTLTFLVEPQIPLYEEETFQVPKYSAGKTLTLGERRSLATTPNRKIIELAMSDPHPMVASRLLSNPKITEDDVIRIAARRSIPPALLSEIAQSVKWRFRNRIAFALLMNKNLPATVGIGLLPSLNPKLVKEIANDARLDIQVSTAAQLLLALPLE